ncbi:MAG: thiamine ABC transporter substrate-binding protein [Nocardioidaceae bacterium]|nr:thiamine ABC transporter substrate-binding protein [Nocardioidaceae bacterium]
MRPASFVFLGVSLAACSLGGTSADQTESGASDTGGATGASKRVVLATHESWSVPKEVLADFTRETGYVVSVQAAGDAGALTNKLVLTKGSPIADAVYGIDNTFASRAVDGGVLAEHEPENQPVSVGEFELPDGDAAEQLTPVDFGDVCVNIDDVWFEEHDVDPPSTFADLVDPTYKGLFVTPGASTSSPGLAFLLATIAEYGEDGWRQYWEDLMANDTAVTAGWIDAYTVDFTAGGGGGDRPIVLSYASSPPFTIPKGERRPTTSALLDTCFRQIEYAGVLDGAENPEGAEALVDFMLSETFQEALPENMYVFPVDDSVKLPPVWARWAETAKDPLTVDPASVTEKRDEWLSTWGEITTR